MWTNRHHVNSHKINDYPATVGGATSGGGQPILWLSTQESGFKEVSESAVTYLITSTNEEGVKLLNRAGGTIITTTGIYTTGNKNMIIAPELTIQFDLLTEWLSSPVSKDNKRILEALRETRRPHPTEIKQLLIDDVKEDKIIRVMREEGGE